MAKKGFALTHSKADIEEQYESEADFDDILTGHII